MIPLLPLLFGLGIGTSFGGLCWYSSLSKDDQVEADRRANELAFKLYQTTVKNLTQTQLDVVHNLVKKSLVG